MNIYLLKVFYYIYALVGMEAFQGKIRFSGYDVKSGSELYCGNALLNNTDFWKEQYCNNNFNDLVHAFIVMFELTVVNQWQDILLFYNIYNLFLCLYIFRTLVV